ncbi:type 4 prepilin peptidase 1 Aspartic peptidase. MEROPS family A24A [Malonomonas rubra DSM 5091]|uniref:Prepilin leader peptidase/N-methyltransferase n=1 Tax=Malonomonas rubra DSM 5091 TaxID=1122189 RepID=A0A1M6D7J9_MALRU|nr:A24 family peptidase [Malonomonas rubra]SHI69169.1 type 4 prepilin peptidase 1 Aspartic peptidase. MEROPS family A24A [Malonomonas rubra DSM 5091]
MPALEIVLTCIFVLGAIFGSFLNVCIYRIPGGMSVVSPASRCPKCETKIRWYQNIPILSWFLLKGRCASCGVNISPRYALVEALNGLLFVLVLWFFGFSWTALIYALFVSLLVVITFIDLDHQIIPDIISLPSIPIGFTCSFAIPWLSWLDSLLGILLGGGLLLVIAWLYEILLKREGMGGGDIKLLAMIGAFLGWKAIFPIIFFASLGGTLIGVPLMLIKGKDSRFALPFGPFLASASIIYLFWGEQIINWYLSFYR